MSQAIIEERRSDPQISLAVMSHMEDRLTAHAVQMERKFDNHTRDEMERYSEILALIAQSNTDHNERHKALLQSVESHMDKTAEIYEHFVEAFPTDKKGKPDFHGHAAAHESWIESSKETKELLGYVKKIVLASAATALVSWITFLIWNGVLHGPGK
jgi:hypothetical protein